MKRVRRTYEGAFHHVINRGINGEEIFSGHRTKSYFLDFLEEYSKKMRIRIISYCIMNNHFLCGAPHKTFVLIKPGAGIEKR